MPKCINSDTGTYNGSEPSPKGLGYCARGEKLGKRKKGLDGYMWEIKATVKGIQRWVKVTKKKSTKKINSTKSSKLVDVIIHKNPIKGKNVLNKKLLKPKKKSTKKKSTKKKSTKKKYTKKK